MGGCVGDEGTFLSHPPVAAAYGRSAYGRMGAAVSSVGRHTCPRSATLRWGVAGADPSQPRDKGAGAFRDGHDHRDAGPAPHAAQGD
jgi:hypothetical protein